MCIQIAKHTHTTRFNSQMIKLHPPQAFFSSAEQFPLAFLTLIVLTCTAAVLSNLVKNGETISALLVLKYNGFELKAIHLIQDQNVYFGCQNTRLLFPQIFDLERQGLMQTTTWMFPTTPGHPRYALEVGSRSLLKSSVAMLKVRK